MWRQMLRLNDPVEIHKHLDFELYLQTDCRASGCVQEDSVPDPRRAACRLLTRLKVLLNAISLWEAIHSSENSSLAKLSVLCYLAKSQVMRVYRSNKPCGLWHLYLFYGLTYSTYTFDYLYNTFSVLQSKPVNRS